MTNYYAKSNDGSITKINAMSKSEARRKMSACGDNSCHIFDEEQAPEKQLASKTTLNTFTK